MSSSLTRPSLVRSALLALGVATGGLVLGATAAAADVTITPAEAVQGDAASVTFAVQNQRPGAFTTKVEVDLPADAPVAEVYPMTVPDWAPKIIDRPVSSALPGIHGSGLTTATSAVIWERAEDAPAAPAVETLRLEMGPMPDVPSFTFTVVQTYSDGTVVRWQGPSSGGPGTTMTLRQPTAEEAQAQDDGHQVHSDGQQAAPGVDAGATLPAAPASASSDGGGSSLDPVAIVGVAGASLALAGAVVFAARGPRRRPEGAGSSADAGSEAAGTGAPDDAEPAAGPAGPEEDVAPAKRAVAAVEPVKVPAERPAEQAERDAD